MQQPKISDLKPGDKFTVEFTVNNYGYVKSGAYLSTYRVTDGPSIFAKMEPTSITPAPRVIKAGDRYMTVDHIPHTILFVSENFVYCQRDGGQYRFEVHRPAFDNSFLKGAAKGATRTWL